MCYNHNDQFCTANGVRRTHREARTTARKLRRLPGWVWLLPAVIAVAAALIFFGRPGATPVTEDTVIIRVDDREYLRVPLSQPQTVTIEQADGSVNVVEVSDHGAVMRSSTCHNQLCVHQGKVTYENYATRYYGQNIICLPNRVTVELVLSDGERSPDAPDV